MRFHLVCFLCLAGFDVSAEPVTFPLELGTLETVGVGSRTYDGVKVISQDAVGIRITHEGGTSRIAYEKLPPELRERFAVDPEAAKAQLRREAEENAAHDRSVQRGMHTPGQEAVTPAGPAAVKPTGGKSETASPDAPDSDEAFISRILSDEPDATGKTKTQRAAAMIAYIARLEQELTKLDADIRTREERYSRNSLRTANYGNGFAEKQVARMANLHEEHNKARKQVVDKLQEVTRDLITLKEGQ